MKTFKLRKWSLDTKSITARLLLKGSRSLMSLCLSALLTIRSTYNSSWVKITFTFLNEVTRVGRHQGAKGLVKTLKSSTVMIQQSLGGYVIRDLTSIGPRISRTGDGLPRWLPVGVRSRIRSGDVSMIRYTLTLTNLFRVIEFTGKIKLETITDPFKGDPQFMKYFSPYVEAYTNLMLGSAASRLLDPKRLVNPQPFPILKSGPTVSKEIAYSSHPLALIRAVLNMNKLKNIVPAMGLKSLMLRLKADELMGAVDAIVMTPSAPFIPNLVKGPKDAIGRLGIKEEAAGKMRVFAMVDPWTQWVLKPFHKVLFGIIRRHPMDGTFNQLAPLARVMGKGKPLYSLDLTAATDRLPISLQVVLFAKIFGEQTAQDWKDVMVGRFYCLPKLNVQVLYEVGQPMGALSSWAMLAYTHHFIVQVAAWQASVTPRNKLFRDYALLGDDIVIANSAVAGRYLVLLKLLGVDCSLAKSILSPKGTAVEFAKRTFLAGVDVSPTPFKEIIAASTFSGVFSLQRKYSMSLVTVLKFLGHGYRVLGSVQKPLREQSRVVKNIILGFMLWTKGDLASIFPKSDRLADKNLVRTFLSTEVASLQRRMYRIYNEWMDISNPIDSRRLLWSRPNWPKLKAQLTGGQYDPTLKKPSAKMDLEIDFNGDWAAKPGIINPGMGPIQKSQLFLSLEQFILKPFLLRIPEKMTRVAESLDRTKGVNIIDSIYEILSIQKSLGSVGMIFSKKRQVASLSTSVSDLFIERFWNKWPILLEKYDRALAKDKVAKPTSKNYLESGFSLSLLRFLIPGVKTLLKVGTIQRGRVLHATKPLVRVPAFFVQKFSTLSFLGWILAESAFIAVANVGWFILFLTIVGLFKWIASGSSLAMLPFFLTADWEPLYGQIEDWFRSIFGFSTFANESWFSYLFGVVGKITYAMVAWISLSCLQHREAMVVVFTAMLDETWIEGLTLLGAIFYVFILDTSYEFLSACFGPIGQLIDRLAATRVASTLMWGVTTTLNLWLEHYNYLKSGVTYDKVTFERFNEVIMPPQMMPLDQCLNWLKDKASPSEVRSILLYLCSIDQDVKESFYIVTREGTMEPNLSLPKNLQKFKELASSYVEDWQPMAPTLDPEIIQVPDEVQQTRYDVRIDDFNQRATSYYNSYGGLLLKTAISGLAARFLFSVVAGVISNASSTVLGS